MIDIINARIALCHDIERLGWSGEVQGIEEVELLRCCFAGGGGHCKKVIYCPARASNTGTFVTLGGFLVSESFVEAGLANFEAHCGLSYGQSIADMALWPAPAFCG